MATAKDRWKKAVKEVKERQASTDGVVLSFRRILQGETEEKSEPTGSLYEKILYRRQSIQKVNYIYNTQSLLGFKIDYIYNQLQAQG